jgi:hypothetical protein
MIHFVYRRMFWEPSEGSIAVLAVGFVMAEDLAV